MNTVTAIKSLVLAKKSDIKLLLKQVIITAIIKSNITVLCFCRIIILAGPSITQLLDSELCCILMHSSAHCSRKKERVDLLLEGLSALQVVQVTASKMEKDDSFERTPIVHDPWHFLSWLLHEGPDLVQERWRLTCDEISSPQQTCTSQQQDLYPTSHTISVFMVSLQLVYFPCTHHREDENKRRRR